MLITPSASLLGLLGLLGPQESQLAASEVETDLGAAIDAWAAPAVAAEHLSGSLLVARGDEVLVERHWGLANRELNVPTGQRTRYCVASINKAFTRALTARLIERGDLELEAKLSAFAPEFPRGDQITIRHLLGHSAGIVHRPVDEGDRYAPRTAAEVLAAAAEKPLLFEPGTQSIYSTGGYGVLARVLELASGLDYDALLQEEISRPLELEATSHVSDRDVLPDRATSYAFGPKGFRHTALQDTSYLVGGGSLYSNPRDLLRFAREGLSGELGESVRLALARPDGLRWNGITDGFRAFADQHLEDDLFVIWCGNVHSGATDLLREAVPALVRGEALEPAAIPEFRPRPVQAQDLVRCEGVYELRPGSELSVRAADGGLYVNDWFLVPEGDGRFFSPQDYGRVEVHFDEEGAPSRLDWMAGGTRTEMPRLRSL